MIIMQPVWPVTPGGKIIPPFYLCIFLRIPVGYPVMFLIPIGSRLSKREPDTLLFDPTFPISPLSFIGYDLHILLAFHDLRGGCKFFFF